MDSPRPSYSAPASSSQQRLWVLHELLDPATYTVALPIQLSPECDLDALERAVAHVVRRHEALRTTLRMSASGLVQDIWPTAAVPLLRTPCDASSWQALALATVRVPFALGTPPLLRAHVYLAGPGDAPVLVLFLHHAVVDGASEETLWADLASYYDGERSGQMPVLADLPLQYADYAEWQQSRPLDPASTAFWQETLADAPAHIGLMPDWIRTSGPGTRADERVRVLPDALGAAVRTCARAAGTTPFLVLLSACAATVARVTGAEDLVIGIPVTGRERPELAGIVGCFVNTVPLRIAIDPAVTGRALLAGVRQTATAAFLHEAVPYDEIVALQSGPARSDALALFFAHRVAARGPWERLGWRALPFALPELLAKFPLSITVGDDGDRIRVIANYPAALYEPGTIDGWLDAYLLALEGLTGRLEARVTDWPLVSSDTARTLLEVWGAAGRSPSAARIDTCVDKVAARRPDDIAVVLGEAQLTYLELRQRADGVARRLDAADHGTGVVAVWADRSLDYVAAIYGVLKTGAAYLPLDPGLPPARRDDILADAGVRALVGPAAAIAALGTSLACTDWGPSLTREEPWTPQQTGDSDALAYVLYTSGSTGRPKGVAVAHRNVTALIFDADLLRLDASDRVLHLSRDTFDVSTYEIWGPLMVGGRTVLTPDVLLPPREFGALIRTHGVTICAPSASYFNLVVDTEVEQLAPLARVAITAEPLSVAHVRRAIARLPHVRLLDAYGPTETTVFSTAYAIPPDVDERWRSIPIGRPIPGTRVAVVDRAGHVAPVGAVGELLIGGAGVSRGYLHRDEETAAAFVDGVVPGATGVRWYRTGDDVRWRADGTLEYVGRRDGQVKVRGQRIELGEVEAVLKSHPGVADAVAAVKTDDGGNSALVGYVVPRGAPPEEATLRRHAATHLPEYMVPGRVLAIDALPRSAHGKLDRSALPRPAPVPAGPTRVVAATPTELRLAALYQRLLRLDHVDAGADFFLAGGHSLLAVQLARAIEDTFTVQLPLRRLWEDATVRGVAAAIDAETAGVAAGPSAIVRLRGGGSGVPLYVPYLLGGALLADDMVAAIDSAHAVLGLAPIASADQGDLIASAEALAEVLAAQGSGPIALAGYSFAGLLAYEIAVALRARGRDVPLVAVIDTGPGNPSSLGNRMANVGRAFVNAPRWLHHVVTETSLEDVLTDTRRQAGAALARISGALGIAHHAEAGVMFAELFGGDPVAEQHRERFETHLHALMTWRPRRFAGDLVVLRARTRPLLSTLEPDLGWRPWVDGRVEIVSVPGTHYTVMKRPKVDVVAREINARLARIR